jgi:hypothetical protein
MDASVGAARLRGGRDGSETSVAPGVSVAIVSAGADVPSSAEARLVQALSADPRYDLRALFPSVGTGKTGHAVFDVMASCERALFLRGNSRAPDAPSVNEHRQLDPIAASVEPFDVVIDFSHRPQALQLCPHARHGVWRLSAFAPFAGFREAAASAPETMVELYRHRTETAPPEKLAEAAYGTKFLAGYNAAYMREKSVQLAQRELARLHLAGTLEGHGQPGDPADAPTLRSILRYGASLAPRLGRRAVAATRSRLGLRPGMFIIKHGRGEVLDFDPAAAQPIVPTGNRYWADPFLFGRNGTSYLFFEDYDYGTRRGRIGVGQLGPSGFSPLGTALDRPYHLSYPYVFESGGEVFLMPEAHQSGRLEIWRAVDFPLRWELHATALEGLRPIDSVLFEDNGRWWLFTNLCHDSFGDYCTELYSFAVDGPALRSIKAHPLNPIIIDARTARGGGRVFRHDGRLYRMSQNNSHGTYGYGLNIMEIDRLDETGYAEHAVRTIEPDFERGIIGCHHVDFLDGEFVVDVRRR